MARVTIEDCLDAVENRFHLVLLASKRARDLMMKGIEPSVVRGNDKATVIALREIAAGHITADYLTKTTHATNEEAAEMVATPTVVAEEKE